MARCFNGSFFVSLMLHIIDANNLAGKLDLLGKEKFDQLLIEQIQTFYKKKKIEVFLVFDSLDLMGDRYELGYLTVVYTPRDSFYRSADDKIVELVRTAEDRQIVVVTDDAELAEEVEDLGKRLGKDLRLVKSTHFAQNLSARLKIVLDKGEKEELADDEIDDINDEMRQFWQ